jgi:hypothetical protein
MNAPNPTPAAKSAKLAFAVACRDIFHGDRTVILWARSQGEALRRAARDGLNVAAIRQANVRPEDAPPPAPRAPRAAAAAPSPAVVRRQAAQSPAERAFAAEWAALLAEESLAAARDWRLYGVGARPAPSAAQSPAPVAGTPRHQLTVNTGRAIGAPFVGEGSRTRPDRGTALAHQAPAERAYAPVYNPAASAGY